MARRQATGRRLQLARLSAAGGRGLSAERCAELAGVSRGAWLGWEQGRSGLDVARLGAPGLEQVRATWLALEQATAPTPAAEPPAEHSLPDAARLLARIAEVCADLEVTPDERPECAAISRELARLSRRFARAAQGGS